MHPCRLPAPRWLWALPFLFLSASPAHAIWFSRGNPVDDDNAFCAVGFDNTEHGHAVCSDGSGGLICGYVGPGGELRINRLDGETGARLWGSEGIEVNVGGTCNSPVHTVSDSAGGAWVVWQDDRAAAPGLYMQRFNASGTPVLAAGGVRLTSALFSTGTDNLDIATTTSGRLLVAYWESDGLHVQRVLPNGGLNLGPTGALATTDAPTHPVRIVPIGENAIVVWGSARASLQGNSGESRILANRVNAGDPTPEWGTEGVVVIAQANVTATLCDAATDGNSLFVTFHHFLNGGTRSIRAQKFNLSGVVQWGTVTVMTEQDTPFDNGFRMKDVRAAEDGAGGMFVAWVDYRNFNQPGAGGFIHNTDLYAQRMNSAGTPQWTANGAAVDTALGTQEDLRLTADGAGGIFLAYTDLAASEDANGDDVSAARVSAAGTRTWKEFITTSFPNDTEEYEPMLARDGFGGLLVAWTDESDGTGDPDVYGLRLAGSNGGAFSPQITVASPNGGGSFTTPDSMRIGWTSNIAGNVKIEYAITGKPRVTIVASTPNDGAFDWITNGLLEGPAKIYVSDAADGSPADSSNTAFTFCAVLDTALASVNDAENLDGLVSGDFNEDGIQDLAIGGLTGIRVRLGLGSGGVGNGLFGASTLVATGAGVRSLAVGDLNEDGRLDLAGVTSAGLFRVLGGGAGSAGDGTFGAPAFFATGSAPRAIVLADFNEDGVLDAAVVNDSSATVSRLLGTGSGGVGNGGFSPKLDLAVQTSPRSLAVDDLDGNGVLDIVVANHGSSSVSILMGSGSYGIGTGGFAAAVNVATATGPAAVAVADLDVDGVPELVVASQGPAVQCFDLSFPGGVPSATAYPLATTGGAKTVTGLVARDFNADMRLDLAVTETTTGLVHVFNGYPEYGVYRLGGTLPGPGNRGMIAALDANEDGSPDLVVAQEFAGANVLVYRGSTCTFTLGTSLAWLEPAAAECLLPNTIQHFQWLRAIGVPLMHVELSRDNGLNWERLRSNVSAVSALDWRVVLPTAAGTARMRVVDAANHNNVAMSAAGFGIRTGLDAPTVYALPDTGRDAVVADFNEDGIADLAVAHRGGVQMLRGLGAAGVGNGLFTVHGNLPSLTPASQVETADLDDDGILDLVIGTDSGYEVRRGQGAAGVGDGSFGGAMVRGLANVTRDLALGDFDENGIPDLVIAPRDSSFVFLALGEGSGGIGLASFGTPTRYALPFAPRAIEVTDANEDNVPDVLAVSGTAAAGQLSWLRGVSLGQIGTGALTAAVSSATDPDPRSMAVLDLNGDRMLDVMVGNGNSGITLHLGLGAGGTGNGSFIMTGDYKAYESGEAISAIAVAPLDGTPGANGSASRDLAIVSENDDDNEHWWLVCRDSSGPDNNAFAHATGFAFGKSEGLVLGDFNEDGYEDVALWSATAGQLRVALGNCSDPKDTFTSPSFINTPNGGNLFAVGVNHAVSWDTQDHLWDVDVTRDDGQNWETVARHVARTSFSWTVTGPNSGNARVRLRRSLAPGAPVVDQSDAVFTIGSAAVDAADGPLPAAVSFSPGWPNPSRGAVRFDLALPVSAAIELDILDAQGRRVASLGGRDFPAGRTTITWEGRSMSGAPVPAGVYFAHLRTPGYDVSRRTRSGGLGKSGASR